MNDELIRRDRRDDQHGTLISPRFEQVNLAAATLQSELRAAAVRGGIADPNLAAEVARQFRTILLEAKAAKAALAEDVKTAMGLGFTTYRNGDVLPSDACDFCARLYNEFQYTGNDGLVNPYDVRYHDGGVHFGRSPEWFAERMQVEGAHLTIGRIGNGEPVSYSLFFTNPNTFPSFAADTQRYTKVPGIEDHLGYTYLFIADKRFLGLGIGVDTVVESMKIAAAAGCRVFAHEYFRAPVPSTASTIVHEAILRPRFGGISVPVLGTHLIENATGSNPALVTYAHLLIPTTPDTKLVLEIDGMQVTHAGTTYPKLARAELGF